MRRWQILDLLRNSLGPLKGFFLTSSLSKFCRKPCLATKAGFARGLLLFVGGCLNGETADLLLPPVMPLDTEYPLQISIDNMDAWIDNPSVIEREKEAIYSALQARIVWWEGLFMGVVLCGLGWILYITREGWFYRLFPPLSPSEILLKKIKETLQVLKTDVDQDKINDPFLFAYVLRLLIAYQKGISAIEMTYEEILNSLASHEDHRELTLLSQVEQALFSGKGLSSLERKALLIEIEALPSLLKSIVPLSSSNS